jgi:exosortase/archaeosortase family protein
VMMGRTIFVGNPPEPLNVAQACSGLRMLMLFFAMCIGVALLIRKPVWEKLLIVASAVPIAMISNMVRIVLTAVLCELARKTSIISVDNARETIHNWVGYLAMMPAGMLLLWLELYLLSKLLIDPLPDRPLMVGSLAGKTPAASEIPAASETRTNNKSEEPRV